ncbi:unnamed protein product (macronuclear) [Paramecium tetraurelia]|uniref:PWWP domain-containing protein n=1 Tax=Paramecium tetraurelia TaxID=5888 RepID=A0C3S3_PARTE|nr:uncharacterized protein GSPATT00034919001 [Paramecium tetraurelia]CAK65440.1 unnamed protein product [Paramecium tetraurelia]|eukprot:XP_001432837.1 hypothetical protein (macronuclear) [Paramecium tetraurelia strain d4-2]
MKSSLKKKQIVWARTKGHPWWPGIVIFIYLIKITQVFDGNQYAINFIGDDSQQGSILMSDNLYDFQEKFEEFNEKVKKNKKLKEAIQTAQKLQSIVLSSLEKKIKHVEQEDKKKGTMNKRNLRKQPKKPETPNKDNTQKSPLQETPQMQQKKQYLDREFQDLLLLLIAAQLNYDQIKQKLTPILDTIEAQVTQNSTITEVLSERKGSILNAVYLILKHQSEQNPDHFFQRDIHQQITRLHDLISKLKNSLLNQFFNSATIIQSLSEVCTNQSREKKAPVQQAPQQKSSTEQTKRQRKIDKTEQKAQTVECNTQIPENVSVQNSNNNNTINNPPNQQKKEQVSNEEAKIEEKKIVNEQPKLVKQDVVNQKKTQKKNEIPDQPLRRKNQFNCQGQEEEQAKKITIKIESLGREADPQMRNKYAKLMWHCIVNLDCKLLKREELLTLIDENADQSEAWSKLTLQPIDRTRKLIHI